MTFPRISLRIQKFSLISHPNLLRVKTQETCEFPASLNDTSKIFTKFGYALSAKTWNIIQTLSWNWCELRQVFYQATKSQHLGPMQNQCGN